MLAALMDAAPSIKGANAVVFGASGGAEEAALLALGAAHVTVIEHMSLTVDHANVTSLSVRAARRAYCAAGNPDAETAAAAWSRFDVAVSASAFDHDGLGRYGDPLSPDADLLAMDEMRCEYLRRPRAGASVDARGGDASGAAVDAGGLALVSVPVGADAVVWNAMRRYGPSRLPLFLAGFDIEARVGWEAARATADARLPGPSYEPIFVLRPSLDADGDAACAAARHINCDAAELSLEAALLGGNTGAGSS